MRAACHAGVRRVDTHLPRLRQGTGDMASSTKAAPKRPARHESKIRYSHELYDALDRYSRSHGGASFQRIVEEALRMFFEGTRKPAAQTRAIARLVLDEIA